MGFAGHKQASKLWIKMVFRGLALLFLVIGLGSCASFSMQAPPAAQVMTTPTAAPIPSPIPTSARQIPEQRLLILEWPPTIRVGDSDIILLTLEVDPEGNLTPTASIQGHQVQGEQIVVPNLYETHYVFAEGRLDISGLSIKPNAEIREGVQPAQSVKFAWSVRPEQAGIYRGMIWLHLIFKPKSGGNEERLALSAQRVEIRGVNLLGLSGNAARWMGAIGSFLGTWLSFDSISALFGKLWEKRQKKDQSTESDQ